jgi:hypothetical protein
MKLSSIMGISPGSVRIELVGIVCLMLIRSLRGISPGRLCSILLLIGLSLFIVWACLTRSRSKGMFGFKVLSNQRYNKSHPNKQPNQHTNKQPNQHTNKQPNQHKPNKK